MCHNSPPCSFLGYQFTTYGWDVLTVTAQNPEDRADPMNIVFPKVTSCGNSVNRIMGLLILTPGDQVHVPQVRT